MKRKLYYLLSPRMRFVVRRIWFFPADLYEKLAGKKTESTPPKGMIFVGSGDFQKQGKHLAELLIDKVQLQPHHKILDIGCGIGRLAIPLTDYLTENGSYEGFDIVKKGIDWCNKHIAKKHPNFHFLHIDLKNDLYNLNTSSEAKNFVFPYDDETFDVIVLTSVFTHMMPEDVDNYLNQINRVLKNGGKCLATFFIINEKIKEQMEKKLSNFIFQHEFETYYLFDKNVKEANVAYKENYLKHLFSKNQLKPEAVYYGTWSKIDLKQSIDYQDVVILSKSSAV